MSQPSRRVADVAVAPVAVPTDVSPAVAARLRRPVPLYWASFLVIGLSLSILGPALTELRDRSGAGIGSIGVLFAGQAAGYVIGSFAGGVLYDRFDGHRLFAAALTLVAFGLFLVPSFTSLPPLFVAFALVGTGAATADVGANAMLMWELGPGTGRAMNVLHLCFGLGALIAPLVVYVGLDLAVRGGAVACLVLAVWSQRVPAPRVRIATVDQDADTTWRLLMLLATFFFLYVGLEVGFAGWIRTYGEEIDLGGLAATWLTTVFWIGFTVGRVLSSANGQRVRPKVVLAISCGVTVVVAGVLVVGDGRPAPVWVGVGLMGLATAPQFPVMLTYLERRIHVTGYATSWFVGAAGLGGLTFPWLIGRWFDASGAAALPWSMLGLSVLTLGSFLVSNRTLGG
jgi:FHS family Na+ dependent glucose MFS transporter 1